MISASILLTTFFVTSAICIYLHLTRNWNYWKKRNIEYAKPKFLFGNFFDVTIFKTFVGDLFHDLHRSTTKPLLGFFCFDQPYLLIRDPEIIKHVLVKDFDHFSDRSILENKTADKIGSGLLFVVKNPVWRTVRIKLTPSMTSGKIKGMAPLMIQSAKNMVEYISSKVVQDTSLPAREIAMKLTTDVITSCAFGIDANSFKNENAEFRVISRRVFDNTYQRAIAALSYFFSPLLVKLMNLKFMDAEVVLFMKNIFEESLENRIKTKVNRNDLIDVLLHLKATDKSVADILDESMLTSQALQFFVAGFETTGSTIFFTLYELAHHPDIQNTLRDSISSTLEKQGAVTYESLQEITYLDMVISETLRKYPVLPYLDRRCTKTYKIPGTDIIIQKGLPVYISLFGLHNDPQYFPEPEKYNPQRFSPENKAKIPGYVYMPFGEGLHNCIGARFALVNVKIALSSLMLNYEISPLNDTEYPMKFNKKAFLLAPEKEEVYLNFKPIKNDLQCLFHNQ